MEEYKLSKVRKLKPFEEFLEVSQNEFQGNIPCYWMILESKKKISEEQIEETLRILYRNIDILRLCIRKEENDEYWFYEMNEERILFQVLKNQSPEEIFSNETHISFESTRPLWRATYITNDETIKERSFFTSNILITFNHAIVDGFTSFNICNSFLKVLNDVIDGNIQVCYDFGQFDEGQETEDLTEQRMEYLKKNPEYFAGIKAIMTKFDSQKVRYNEFFPVLEDLEKKSKYIHGKFEEEATTRLLKVFKSKGVSFHAGFCAAINWVIMELLTENGLTDKEIELLTEHAINLRRYWKKSTNLQLGSHVAVLKLISKTDKNVGANFWQYARDFSNTLKNAIESMQGIDTNVQLTTSDFGGAPLDFSKLFKNYPPSKSYYCTSNMGDLSSIIQGRREHVRIKWLTRACSVQCMNHYFVPFIHTYEGRFLYCVAYSTVLVRDDTANQIVERLLKKLKLLSNMQ